MSPCWCVRILQIVHSFREIFSRNFKERDVPLTNQTAFLWVGSNFAFFKYLVERKVSYRPQHCALRAGQKANNKSAQGEKKGGVFPKTVL